MAALENKHITIEISLGSIVKGVLFVLLVFILYFLRDIVAVVLFSIVIASAIEPAVNWFQKKHIPRVLSIIFIYLSIFAIFGLTFYLVVPTFIGEIANFANQVPGYFKNASQLQSWFGFTSDLPNSFSPVTADIFIKIQNQIANFTSGFLEATTRVFGGAMSFFLIIVLSFYLAVQKNGLEKFLRIITPVRYETYILDLWLRSRQKIGLWLQGQILLGVLVGILVFLGLSILQVEYALSFALLAAVFELIPIFGPILASIPAIVIAFLQGPALGVAVMALYVIIQQFENHLIYPLVVKKIVGVPPILAILAIIIGGKLGGFLGILLAIPIATTLKEFLNDVAAKKHISML